MDNKTGERGGDNKKFLGGEKSSSNSSNISESLKTSDSLSDEVDKEVVELKIEGPKRESVCRFCCFLFGIL